MLDSEGNFRTCVTQRRPLCLMPRRMPSLAECPEAVRGTRAPAQPRHPAKACCWQQARAAVTGPEEDLRPEGTSPVSPGPPGPGLSAGREGWAGLLWLQGPLLAPPQAAGLPPEAAGADCWQALCVTRRVRLSGRGWVGGSQPGVGPGQDGAPGLGQAWRWCSWRSSSPLAFGGVCVLWWLSHALRTVLNRHLPSPPLRAALPPLGSAPDLIQSGWQPWPELTFL